MDNLVAFLEDGLDAVRCLLIHPFLPRFPELGQPKYEMPNKDPKNDYMNIAMFVKMSYEHPSIRNIRFYIAFCNAYRVLKYVDIRDQHRQVLAKDFASKMIGA